MLAAVARPRSFPAASRRLWIRLTLLAVAAAVAGAFPAAAAAKPANVKVMSRNVYLGADLGPGTTATGLQELANAAGVILSEVDQNAFATRAKGLAAEIRQRNPHLVGLQEVALWRTGPCTNIPIPPKATDVRYDFLDLLLDELNRGRNRYRAVVTQNEFDFEVYVNQDGNESTAAPGCPLGSELNGRLTMRDVILARRGGVKTSRARSDNFDTLLQVRPGGVPVDVTRGWTRVDAKVKSRRFRFVNTHLEAFDNQAANGRNNGPDVGNGEIREAQARELFAPGGPARSKRRVILLGDLNSDVETAIRPGDERAFQSLLDADFVVRGPRDPFSCCLNSSLLTETGGGAAGDFDHIVDHILTDTPRKVRLRSSAVTGLAPVNGFWSSDHAGVFSSLRLR
jgi:endonuclease/exonuclease/phosphatase family metal-dependent hydrolase